MSNVLETNKMMEDVLRSLGLGPNPSSEELLNGMKDAIGQQAQNTYKPGLLGNAPQEYSAGVNVDTPMTVGGVDINQSAPIQYSGGTFQGGLLGQTPATLPATDNSAENTLNSLKTQNQQATQQMADLSQQAIQQGIQSAQGLQVQRQADMNATAQQAAQLAQQQAQQESAFGGLLGGLINKFLIPVKFGGGRK